MKYSNQEIYKKLHEIYDRHRRRYRANFDSGQMCLMWSTCDPPDVIEGTEPICDIEVAFDVEISDEDALDIYDMTLEEATIKLASMIERKRA